MSLFPLDSLPGKAKGAIWVTVRHPWQWTYFMSPLTMAYILKLKNCLFLELSMQCFQVTLYFELIKNPAFFKQTNKEYTTGTGYNILISLLSGWVKEINIPQLYG